MKIENLTEARELLNTVRNFLIEADDETKFNAMYDDLFLSVTDALFTSKKVEHFDTKRKETNEIQMYKVVYRRSIHDNNFYLCLENAYSINEFTHDYHIYEVITTRLNAFSDDFDSRNIYKISDYDYKHKILVLCDFDRSSCYNKQYIEDFDEEITNLAIDMRFENTTYSLKQIS